MLLSLSNKRTLIIVWFLSGILFLFLFFLISSFAWAHGGHGDEEAENLGGSAPIIDSWAVIVSPIPVETSSISLPSYPGILISDNYGSVFPERPGIISELLVNIWDRVKKGQKLALINAPTNTPEVIGMIASQRADIAIARGSLDGASEKLTYINSILTGPNNTFTKVYDVKRRALDVQYEVELKQLNAKIASLRANLEARWVVINSKITSSTATIAENEQKITTAEKFLIWKTNEAIAELLRVFYNSDRNNLGVNSTSYGFYWGYNSNWWSLGVSDRQKILDIPDRFHKSMQSIMPSYPLAIDSSRESLKSILKKLEEIINDGNTIYAIISPWAVSEYATNKKTMLELLSGDDGIIILESRLRELEKWVLWSSASASGELSQANADLIGLKQELALLESEKSLLEANKQKDYATVSGEQSLASIDLERLKIEAQTEKIWAENQLKALQNALGAIQNSVRVSYVTAPFDGIISRKNVSIWQSVDVTTPIFDLAGEKKEKSLFVRFDVPVSEYRTLRVWQDIQISLPWDQENIRSVITRYASSVDKDDQTLSVEAIVDEPMIPIGTQVRVIKSGLSGTGQLEIPSSSIFEEEWKAYVYKVLPDKTIKKWEVFYEAVWEKLIVTKWLNRESQIIANIKRKVWKEWENVSTYLGE